jgi:hypothetical protein
MGTIILVSEYNVSNITNVRFEVFMVVKMQVKFFGVVTLCSVA